MEQLSPEIMALIAAHLCEVSQTPFLDSSPDFSPDSFPDPFPISRAPYAVISRRWQDFVEPWTFSSINLRDTELDTFVEIFVDSRRRGLLRHLTYYIWLPTGGQSRDDSAENQTAVSYSILKLLNVLKDWDDTDARLELQVFAIHDDDTVRTGMSFECDVTIVGSPTRYIRLDEVELPTVQCVVSLDIETSPDCALHPIAMCQLAGTFPHLEKLTMEVLDPVNRRRRMRKDHRLALAAGLATLKLPKLTHLSIHRATTTDIRNHNFRCGDFEEDGFDALNDALRELSQTTPLTDLVLTNILISSDLFRSRRTADPDSSIWPTLRNFSIKAGINAPNGRWYYTGDPDAVEPGRGSSYGDDDGEPSESEELEDYDPEANGVRPGHHWRTQPDPGPFNALVKDMADAVLRMPQLRTGTLDIGPHDGYPDETIFKCAEATYTFDDRPDQQSDSDEEKATRRWHVWVGENSEWEVPTDVKVLWTEWLGDSGKFAISRWYFEQNICEGKTLEYSVSGTYA
ncbi:hypothetical protein F5B19DRAFT_490654 [Rostrohypoxylon terebratum]|nr:hypothetical protein F5B19DRAFT_490654 [Rostrohypoxylon terebratum]